MFGDIMVDLETMGTGGDAAIVAIGAVAFDRSNGTICDESFYTVADLESSMKHGGRVTASTMYWWLEQGEAARRALLEDKYSLPAALQKFSEWVRRVSCDDVRMWGNGSDFDNVILATAYRNTGLPAPWEFWSNRCYRTLKSEHPAVPKPLRKGVAHRALDDAHFQTEHLLAIDKAVKGRGQ